MASKKKASTPKRGTGSGRAVSSASGKRKRKGSAGSKPSTAYLPTQPQRAKRSKRGTHDESSTSAPASLHDVEPGVKRSRLPIVGIGASAGGLAALEAFFQQVPETPGFSAIVQVHQNVSHASLLPELLAKHTRMRVRPAGRITTLTANEALVIPPGMLATVEGTQLRLVPARGDAARLPIDVLFRSIARQCGEDAVGIVLSGNGSDGTLGINEIKGAGGLVLAQLAETAQYKGMPTSAIATQRVDYVLPPQDMLERILQYVQGRYRFPVPAALPDERTAEGDSLARILGVLRARTGNDFAAYKKSTIRRRVERRLAVHGIESAAEYARFLERTPYEVDALFREVLISVTSFFRDAEAFAALEEELLKLMEQKPEDGHVRVWVAGCATGEEAYSIAILLKEISIKTSKNLRVQVFATDLDHQAVEVARNGRYPAGIAADVSPERLKRFFMKEDDGYRIDKDIREMLIFASQNVTKDPPFTKLDVVTCRNLLIYLESELQKRVLSLFGYALLPSGVLMLGTSESITGFDDRFVTVDKKWKIFRRRASSGAMGTVPQFASDLPIGPGPRGMVAEKRQARPQAGIGTVVERLMLSMLVAPSAVISDRGEIIYLHGRTGPFLEPAAGEPTNNLFTMAREGLRAELPTVIRQASAQDEIVVRRGLQVKTNGGFSAVTLTAQRLLEPELLRGAFMVTFQIEIDPPKPVESARRPPPAHKRSLARIQALEVELQRTRENLQGTIEELEASNEELKSTNEEMQSTNEELQSANEELETSREEMQSLNEELQTVNSELEERNRALSQTNDDMQNLLNSTEVATIFLDDKLAIKRFTTQAKKVFSLIDSDIGRPLSDLAANLLYDGLLEDARSVLRTLVFREAEIQTREGAWRLMRIMPYRTHDNLIDGLVITFIDIDRIKRAEIEAEMHSGLTDSLIEALAEPLVVIDERLMIVLANKGYYETFRTTPKLEIGETFDSVGDGRWNVPELLTQIHGVFEGSTTTLRCEVRRDFARETTRGFAVHGTPLPNGGTRRLLLVFREL